MSEAQVRERRMKGFAAYAALEALPMPAIAVVQGPVVGSGCEIAGACDFIVATPEASFRTPEATRAPSARRSACRASSASAWPRT